MNFFVFIMIAVLPTVLLTAIFMMSAERDSARTKALKAEIGRDPTQVSEVHIHDNEPIMVYVKMAGRELKSLSGMYGLEAFEYFQHLMKICPGAIFKKFQNGRQID